MEENCAENQTPRRQHTQHPTHQAHKKKKSGTAKTVIGTILAIGLTTCLMFFAIFMVYVHTSLDLNVDISAYTLKQSSTVYYQDKTSGEWVELTKLHGEENRTLVSIDDIPKHVQEALISIEDERFYNHHGVDWKSTARAILGKLTGTSTRGGSTITQQVIKNTTGENEVTIKRKVAEIFRALRLEKNYSKEEILETYFNKVYFGNGCYGIEAAAEGYFGKTVGELSIAEAASIVGITQFPYKYDPRAATGTASRTRSASLPFFIRCTSSARSVTKSTSRRRPSRSSSHGMRTLSPPPMWRAGRTVRRIRRMTPTLSSVCSTTSLPICTSSLATTKNGKGYALHRRLLDLLHGRSRGAVDRGERLRRPQ